jgi:hypothetical protein
MEFRRGDSCKRSIKSETLTSDLVFVDALENGTEIEFDEIKQ